MGTKGGKPLSTLEKRQRKLVKEEAKKAVKEEKKEKAVATISLDPAMVTKALEEVSNASFATPYTLSQKLGVKYSMAKKLIKELAKNSSAKILAKNRRVILISKK